MSDSPARIAQPAGPRGSGCHPKRWVLVAAYDVSLGETSEGHIAFQLLNRLQQRYRIVLLTRCNNRDRLRASALFRRACPSLHVVGFDLPRWARWWKRGALGYRPYAWLWQIAWPLALRHRSRPLQRLGLVHVLNFHNDSIPAFGWLLGRPCAWGPINHNERALRWRRMHWPFGVSLRHEFLARLRSLLYRVDPFLRLSVRKADVIFSAGDWVEARLRPVRPPQTLSQLGVDPQEFQAGGAAPVGEQAHARRLLVCAGRFDWFKGVDLAIEAVARLPQHVHLLVIGTGPAEGMLRRLVGQLGLGDRVEFRPPVARGELARIFARADALVFPSPEAAGLVWVEALACGLPVVGFDGRTELAQVAPALPGIFLASPTGDRDAAVGALAAAVVRTLKQPIDCIRIREAALGRYAWQHKADVIAAAWDSLLAASA